MTGAAQHADMHAVAMQLQRLRLDFDGAFAQPCATSNDSVQDFIAVRCGDARLAVRISEAAGLERRVRLVALPNAPAAMLGLAGLHRQLLPVYDLARIIGTGDGVCLEADCAAWVVLAACPSGGHVGLAVARFEGLLRATKNQVMAAPTSAHAVSSVLDLPGGRLPILDLPTIITLVTADLSTPSRDAS